MKSVVTVCYAVMLTGSLSYAYSDAETFINSEVIENPVNQD